MDINLILEAFYQVILRLRRMVKLFMSLCKMLQIVTLQHSICSIMIITFLQLIMVDHFLKSA